MKDCDLSDGNEAVKDDRALFDSIFGAGKAESIVKSVDPIILACWEQLLQLSFYARYWVGHKAGMSRSKKAEAEERGGRFRQELSADPEIKSNIQSRLAFLALAEKVFGQSPGSSSPHPSVLSVEQLLEEGVGSAEILTRVKATINPSLGGRLESECVRERVVFSSFAPAQHRRYSYRMMLNVLREFIPICQRLLRVQPLAVLEQVAVVSLKKVHSNVLWFGNVSSVQLGDAGQEVITIESQGELLGLKGSDGYLMPRGNVGGGVVSWETLADWREQWQGNLKSIFDQKKRDVLEEIVIELKKWVVNELLCIYEMIGCTQVIAGRVLGRYQELITSSQKNSSSLIFEINKASIESLLAAGQGALVLQLIAQELSKNGFSGLQASDMASLPGGDAVIEWYKAYGVLDLHKNSNTLRRYIIGILLYDIYSGHAAFNSVYGSLNIAEDNAWELIKKISETKAFFFTTKVVHHSLYCLNDIKTLGDVNSMQRKSLEDLLSLEVVCEEVLQCEMFEEWANTKESQTSSSIKNRFKGLYKIIVEKIEKIDTVLDKQVRTAGSSTCQLKEGAPFQLWDY